jgi:hypothetical protein
VSWTRIDESPAELTALLRAHLPAVVPWADDPWQNPPFVLYRAARDGERVRFALHYTWLAPAWPKLCAAHPGWSSERKLAAMRALLKHEREWGPGDLELVTLTIRLEPVKYTKIEGNLADTVNCGIVTNTPDVAFLNAVRDNSVFGGSANEGGIVVCGRDVATNRVDGVLESLDLRLRLRLQDFPGALWRWIRRQPTERRQAFAGAVFGGTRPVLVAAPSEHHEWQPPKRAPGADAPVPWAEPLTETLWRTYELESGGPAGRAHLDWERSRPTA